MKDTKTTEVRLRITPREKQALKNYSEENNIPMSEIIRNAVKKEMNSYED